MKAPIRRGLFMGVRKALCDFAADNGFSTIRRSFADPTPWRSAWSLFMDDIQQRWLCALSAPMAALNTGAGYADPAFCDDRYIDLRDSWGSMIGDNCSRCSKG